MFIYQLLTSAYIALDFEHSAPAEATTSEYMQFVSMEYFFARISNSALHEFSQGRSVREICDWQITDIFNVQCKDNRIENIHIQGVDYGNFDIAITPPTVQSLVIVRSIQLYPVETENCPREARNINLSGNSIYGTIDLRRLPSKLQFLSLDKNKISGSIDVTQLPRSMRFLNLRHNEIKQVVLFTCEFSPHLHSIELYGNNIQEVMPIGRNDKGQKKKVNLRSEMKNTFGVFTYGTMGIADLEDA